MEIIYCVVSFIVGVICAFIAGGMSSSKGRSYSGGFFIGLFLGLIGVIIVAILPKDDEVLKEKMLEDGTGRKCPYCAEIVKREAIVCKHCGKDLPVIVLTNAIIPNKSPSLVPVKKVPTGHRDWITCSYCDTKQPQSSITCNNCGSEFEK